MRERPGLDDLPELLVSGRAERLLTRMADRSIDVLAVAGPSNRRWLTSFTGSSGVVTVSEAGVALYTDGRYRDQARTQLDQAGLADAELVISPDPYRALAESIGSSVLGLEADTITWSDQMRLSEMADVVPTAGWVEELRMVKDDAELARIEAAAAVADLALEANVHLLATGISEIDFARKLLSSMQAAGAAGEAYGTIVASGPNAALPHATPTDRPVGPDDVVIVDVGALVDGYRSDMTRTFTTGRPGPEIEEMIAAATDSQAEGVRVVRPDIETQEIDKACRDAMERHGRLEQFVHGTGHGVGLDIHELPAVRPQATAILRPGHVITVEPGAYLTGVGGARIEDTVVVTETGCRTLTNFPKSPTIA